MIYIKKSEQLRIEPCETDMGPVSLKFESNLIYHQSIVVNYKTMKVSITIGKLRFSHMDVKIDTSPSNQYTNWFMHIAGAIE